MTKSIPPVQVVVVSVLFVRWEQISKARTVKHSSISTERNC